MWHCDDEALFGECGETKLIVSVTLGASALFKWKVKSCSDNEVHLCLLDHGDILVMDGQCQDKFLHCTDPGLKRERMNVTFRWIKQHVASCSFLKEGLACCLPTCAQVLSVPGMGNFGFGVFWAFWFLFGVLRVWEEEEEASFASLLLCVYRAWVTEMCLLLGTPFGQRSVEALSL